MKLVPTTETTYQQSITPYVRENGNDFFKVFLSLGWLFLVMRTKHISLGNHGIPGNKTDDQRELAQSTSQSTLESGFL